MICSARNRACSVPGSLCDGAAAAVGWPRFNLSAPFHCTIEGLRKRGRQTMDVLPPTVYSRLPPPRPLQPVDNDRHIHGPIYSKAKDRRITTYIDVLRGEGRRERGWRYGGKVGGDGGRVVGCR